MLSLCGTEDNTLKINTLLSLALLSTSGYAASISTGVAPWQVNGNPAVIETTIATPFWINNFGDGRWVGSSATDGAFTLSTDGALPGTYVFTLAIGALVGSSGGFTLQYAADNTISWALSNGILAGDVACNSFADCYSSANGATRNLAGAFAADSVLTGTLFNVSSQRTPMGLLVVGTAFETESNLTAAVPEPATLALLGTALAVLGLRKRRR